MIQEVWRKWNYGVGPLDIPILPEWLVKVATVWLSLLVAGLVIAAGIYAIKKLIDVTGGGDGFYC